MRRMAVLVALPIVVAGCGGSSSDTPPGGGATTEAAAAPTQAAPTQPAAGAAGKTGYATPTDIAEKIKKAGLGCAKPKPAEVAGGKKVTCTVKGEHVNIEIYPSEKVFKQVMKAVCGTGIRITSVTDGKRWDVTPDTTGTAKSLQKVVGGRVENICDHV